MSDEWMLFWTGQGGAEGDLRERERRLGLRDRQPILVSPDFRVDPRLSEFFRRSKFALRAAGTQESYVLDYRLLFTFLWQRGLNWDRITAGDLEDYEYWRRRDKNNPHRIGGSKWGRELAAFRMLYDWAVRHRHMAGSPVVLRTKQLPDGSSVEVPELAPTDYRSSNVKWLTPRAYRAWRDVGLRGYTPAGLPNVTWRGRNDGRDTAFADFVLSSGLRRREAGTLLLPELPDTTTARQRYYAGHVARDVAKRSGRFYYVERSVLKAVEAYCVSTRAEAVARAQRTGIYDRLPNRRLVQHISPRGSVRWVDASGRLGMGTLDTLDDLDRLDLYIEGENGLEPLAVWLTESGLPMRYRSWNRVFGLANARCQAQGMRVFCSPHMLRHSFALQQLISLHYALDRRLGSNDQNLWIPGGRAFPEDDRRSHRILIKTSVGALAGRHARAHG
ncbi:site-specific integrase, partial [Nocardia puris]|uniref:site-specific integrase n=1 Tax=Nocardia puris TaxID=208602 RepID=UPI0018937049